MGRLRISVNFSDLLQWDVKQFFAITVKSKYIVEKLGKHLSHETEKFEIMTLGEKLVGILGVSNKQGMFDAETTKACNISQKYHRVDNDWLAYNPYRVNVGSIGLKTIAQKGEYISPAYVVFSCKKTILPEYIYRLAKTQQFNKLIRNSTTGTVRQTLSFEKLSEIEAPIPPIAEQRKILDEYNRLKLCAKNAENAALEIEERIENLLYDRLEIHNIALDSKNAGRILKTWRFSKLKEWDVAKRNSSITPDELFNSYKYNCKLITEMCSVNPTTSLSELGNKDVSFIPMECVCEKSGTIKEYRAEKASKSAGYTRFKDNDVLWAKITPCMQNGKCTVAKGLKNGYGFGSTEFNVFRVNPDELLPEYLHLFLRSKRLRSLAQDYFTGSSGQQRVSSKFFESLKIPVIAISSSNPSEITQEKIVKEAHDLRDKWAKKIEETKELKAQADMYFESAVFE